MVKKIVAGVLVLLAAGGWFYADYANKQAQLEIEEMHKALDQARAQTQARVAAKAKFEAQILADLNACKTEAEKIKNEFVAKNQQPVRRKPGQFTLSPAAEKEAKEMLETANSACQTTYDTRLNKGS